MTPSWQVLSTGFYTLDTDLVLTMFNGIDNFEHTIPKGELFTVQVVYNSLVDGKITSKIITKEKYSCVLKGDYTKTLTSAKV